jgi:hypothetical protein
LILGIIKIVCLGLMDELIFIGKEFTLSIMVAKF